MRERAALAIALTGIVLAPVLTPQYGYAVGVGAAAIFAAVGIALFPERA